MNTEISFNGLVEFMREVAIEDYGYEDVRDADSIKVLTYFISPHKFTKDKFIKSCVLENLAKKIDIYPVQVDSRHELVNSSINLYRDFADFNSTVVYISLDEYDKVPKLSVLDRNNLSEEDTKKLIQRGREWLEVLYATEKNKEIKNFCSWRLSNTIESLIAKTDSEIDWPFVYLGKVVGFAIGDDEKIFPNVPFEGMVVDGYENGFCSIGHLLPLINAKDSKKFGHLIGKDVKYHFQGICRDAFGAPYGELISI